MFFLNSPETQAHFLCIKFTVAWLIKSIIEIIIYYKFTFKENFIKPIGAVANYIYIWVTIYCDFVDEDIYKYTCTHTNIRSLQLPYTKNNGTTCGKIRVTVLTA